MVPLSRVALIALILPVLAGCHIEMRGDEAYKAANIQNSQAPVVMDPGSYGGTSFASGGVAPGTSFGTGSTKEKYDGHTVDGNPSHYDQMKKLRQQQFGDGPVNWTGNP